MKKFFCDRCGEEVDTTLKFFGGPNDRLYDINFLVEDKHSGATRDGYITESFEICYECFLKGSKILREWFDNEV